MNKELLMQAVLNKFQSTEVVVCYSHAASLAVETIKEIGMEDYIADAFEIVREIVEIYAKDGLVDFLHKSSGHRTNTLEGFLAALESAGLSLSPAELELAEHFLEKTDTLSFEEEDRYESEEINTRSHKL